MGRWLASCSCSGKLRRYFTQKPLPAAVLHVGFGWRGYVNSFRRSHLSPVVERFYLLFGLHPSGGQLECPYDESYEIVNSLNHN
jgi:hypothetical protein